MTEREPQPTAEGNNTPHVEGEGGGDGPTSEDPPPQNRPRTTDEEDQPLKEQDAVTIDRKTLLMLMKTVKELKEGVKRGHDSRAGSSALTKASGPSEDEELQEDEDFD